LIQFEASEILIQKIKTLLSDKIIFRTLLPQLPLGGSSSQKIFFSSFAIHVYL
jgi:hypothetical protein